MHSSCQNGNTINISADILTATTTQTVAVGFSFVIESSFPNSQSENVNIFLAEIK